MDCVPHYLQEFNESDGGECHLHLLQHTIIILPTTEAGEHSVIYT